MRPPAEVDSGRKEDLSVTGRSDRRKVGGGGLGEGSSSSQNVKVKTKWEKKNLIIEKLKFSGQPWANL